jgi:hypothetical protein
MPVDPAAAGAALSAPRPPKLPPPPPEAGGFQQALDAAGAGVPAPTAAPSGPTLASLVDALERVNSEASGLASMARALEVRGSALSPGEMIMMSMRCNEFLFHCELTANMANRSSDGLQQLFKEQG